jgi:succinate-acetate transporter protein
LNRVSSTTSSWSWIGFSFIGPGALKGKTAKLLVAMTLALGGLAQILSGFQRD